MQFIQARILLWSAVGETQDTQKMLITHIGMHYTINKKPITLLST